VRTPCRKNRPSQERVDPLQGRRQPRRQHTGGVGRDVFVREIDMGLDVGEHRHEGIAQGLDAPRQGSGQLGPGRTQGPVGLGVDHVGHRLGLGEIHAPVQEGAAGELPGFGRSGSRDQERLQHAARHEHAPMTCDLHGVFAGERLGPPKHRHDHVIHANPIPNDLTEDGHPGLETGRRTPAGRSEAAVGHAQCLSP
jgi:hypothetical protein